MTYQSCSPTFQAFSCAFLPIVSESCPSFLRTSLQVPRIVVLCVILQLYTQMRQSSCICVRAHTYVYDCFLNVMGCLAVVALMSAWDCNLSALGLCRTWQLFFPLQPLSLFYGCIRNSIAVEACSHKNFLNHNIMDSANSTQAANSKSI